MAEPYVPTVSAKARTRIYITCLALGVVTVLVCTLLALARVVDVVTAVAIVGAVNTACATFAGGLGVAYRPTRPDIADSGVPLR